MEGKKQAPSIKRQITNEIQTRNANIAVSFEFVQ
jgi:hypothetical protein